MRWGIRVIHRWVWALIAVEALAQPLQQRWQPEYVYPYPDAPPPQVYQQRRQYLLQSLGQRSIVLVYAAPKSRRVGDVFYPYRQSSWLWYLTGVVEPEAVLCLVPWGIEWQGERVRELLFLPPRQAELERWEGARMGPREARQLLGIPAFPLRQLDSLLPLLLAQADTVYVPEFPRDLLWLPLSQRRLLARSEERRWLREKFGNVVLGTVPPVLQQMRARKDTAELRLLRKAVDITVETLTELLGQLRPGMGEWEVHAFVEAGFRRRGAEGAAFPTIVASGEAACILHYTAYRHRLDSGELVLIDCGAEYTGYAADITRTVPVSGRFTPEQRRLYEIVLEAQDSAIAACRPGMSWRAPHERAVAVLARRLRELGILDSAEHVRFYFPHATTHHVGLEVHDVGPTDSLRAGYVIAVEPGVYIPPGSPCERRWWGIGIRIEDTVLVSEEGPVVLSAALPRRPEQLEAMLQSVRQRKR